MYYTLTGLDQLCTSVQRTARWKKQLDRKNNVYLWADSWEIRGLLVALDWTVVSEERNSYPIRGSNVG